MSRVILKYRNIAQGKMKSIYLEFNPAIHDIKGNCVRYECLNLKIYTNPVNNQQFKHNRAVEEIAERLDVKDICSLSVTTTVSWLRPGLTKISWIISE